MARLRRTRWWMLAGASAAVLLGAIQFVPVAGLGTNPPVASEPAWDSPETRALAARACFDCHSHLTTWPAYARVAPASWLVAYDVREGRDHLNFSEWQDPQEDAEEAPEVVREEEMPPRPYLLMHPKATLTAEERERLARGLALIAGGAGRSELKFNRTSAGMSAGMLALSVVALGFPALYHAVHPEAAARAAELRMSEAVALILILTYGCSLLFTLRTHRVLFGAEAHPIRTGQLAVFGAGDGLRLAASTSQESRSPELEVLVLGGRPIREPVAWYGPFVMNTRDELLVAFEDYQAGRLGTVPAVHHTPDHVVETSSEG